MGFAREEARALGHAGVGTEHLLLGILRCEQSPAVRALGAMGVSIDDARAAAAPTLVEQAPPDPAAADESPPSRLGRGEKLTRHARQVLEQSLRETLDRGEGYIGVEHLLLALLHHEQSGASQTLERLGIHHEEALRALERAW